MHLSLWKPISHCAALLMDKKSSSRSRRGKDGSDSATETKMKNQSILRKREQAEGSSRGSIRRWVSLQIPRHRVF
ncbi:hypothetical protein L484_003535 [Morus notabilis]|uniref:Uncharacterized protein n=1 Tax=Morus notabilis TaxID=981085 RepID=W9SFX2_9ROSA|nr:hypothetical protein L484_003535 [Morus notabilis]